MLVTSEYPTLLMSDRGKSAGVKNRKTMLVAFLSRFFNFSTSQFLCFTLLLHEGVGR
ncbi:Hypothetical protein FORC18_3230 [Vibrio parahaemolyticus]|nr:hypothetical protein FORC8_3223 [Vibrio parahaemolyticus]APE85843.1 Hypothetical protein FORC18_3230 [Vibrio parahaemolyticus]